MHKQNLHNPGAHKNLQKHSDHTTNVLAPECRNDTSYTVAAHSSAVTCEPSSHLTLLYVDACQLTGIHTHFLLQGHELYFLHLKYQAPS
jgi:hypothetical protein